MRSKTVVIAGAPTGCWTNVGDEAILAGMLKDLREVEPNVSVIVISSNPKGALARYGVKEVPYDDLIQIVSVSRSSDLMILGGGSIFFDYWGFNPNTILTRDHEGLAFFAGFALLATLLSKPLMIYGVGVGPLLSEDGKRFTRLAFEQAQLATVRDEESKALLQSLGTDGRCIQITADPAFAFQAASEDRVRQILETESDKELARPFVGVALRNWNINVKPEIWERDVATALDNFIERHGGALFFVALHRAVDWPLTDDAGVAHRVINHMKHKANAIVLEGDYQPEEKAGVLHCCELVLGMRLHSIIFAIQGGVPAVALSYDPKVSSALSGVGLKEYSIDLASLTSEKLTTLLDKAFENRALLRASLSSKLKPLADSARENARLAIEMINENGWRAPAPSSLTAEFVRSPEIERALKACNLHHAAETLLLRTENQERIEAIQPQLGHLGISLERARQAATGSNGKRKSPRTPPDKKSKPRVACLTNRLLDWDSQQLRIGGAERYCLMLGRLLTDLGLDITFYQAASKGFEGDFFGFKVIALPFGDMFSEFQYGVCDAFFELSADYDHVIYNMVNYASGRVRDDSLMICHGIWFDHNYFEPPFAFRTPEWFEHLYRAFSQQKKIVSVDANSINVIRSLWPDLSMRMTYLPNFVDTKLFHPPAERTSNPVTIIIPRRTEPIRGSELLGPIVERIPHDCRIWWVGEGEERDNERIRFVARRDPRVKFYGASFEEMPELYRKSDICVLPTVGSEGMSLACLEALASGCAVVTTIIGGLPELIQPGVNGLLVDPKPKQIADAINYLIEEPEARGRLQAAGRQTALAFDLEIWRERWTTLLDELGWINRKASSQTTKESFEPMIKEQDIAQYEIQANQQIKKADEETEPELFNRAELYDIICFSIIDWEFRYQRPQQLVSQFADQGHRVFYLRISKHLRVDDKRYKVTKLRNNVWEVMLSTTQPIDLYSGKLPPGVARFFAEDLRAVRNEFYITRAVSVVHFPTWAATAYSARDSFGWPIVYDCMDNWSTFPGMETLENLLAQERQLVRSADLLVVSSETLWEKWSRFNSNSVLARNAADFARFNNPPSNTLLADAPAPIVGYFGAIAQWFDIDLMTRLAKERPEYTFVLLGDAYGVAMDELQSLPNVRALGVQPYEQMPAYLVHFDACIIPFLVNEVTEAMDVVKFYEYVSQGKPVVAPRMRELLTYKDYLYLADDADDFIRKVDRAVLEKDANLKERRIGLARRNTWQSRLKLIKAGIEKARRKVMTPEMLRILVGLLQEAPDVESQQQGDKWLLERAAFHLNASLAEREQAVQIMNDRLTDREHKIIAASSQVEAQKNIVALRDATIAALQVENESLEARLSREQSELSKTNGALGSLLERVDKLEAELLENKRSSQALSAQLAAKEAELHQIESSLGWRLLSRYGRIKYRYLLPIYRVLGLPPYDKKRGSSVHVSQLPLGQSPDRVRTSDPSLRSDSTETEEALTTVPVRQEELCKPSQSNTFDVVCFPIIDWDFRFQRPQQLMSRFAGAGHRVFYISQAFHAAGQPYLIKVKGNGIYEVSLRGPALNVYTDLLGRKARDELFASLNALRRDLSLGAVAAFVQLPFWWPLAMRVRDEFAWPTIYDCMDHHAGFSTNRNKMLDQEDDLLQSADLVIASSAFLEQESRQHNANVLLVRNACDYEHFAKSGKPEGARPVIGYYGAISDWFDSDLVADIAERRPDWDFVLVGSTRGADVKRISKLPNIVLPGEKHYSEIPGLLGKFDVAIIPFKRSPLTEATNPVKAYEILAAGKPLVSVPIPEVAALAPLARLASTVDEFESEIIAALDESDPEFVERRRAFAREHTWEKRFELFNPAVCKVFPKASIIIVTFNNLELNRLCLESLYSQTEWPNFEVIVLDNASTDGTPEYLKAAEESFPNLRVILNNANLGFARANNLGLRQASGEYLVLLNNDTVLARGWLSALIRHLHADPKIGLIGPVTNEIGNEAKIPVGYTRLEDMPLWAAKHVRENDNLLFDIPMLAMFCVAMRREVFERVGLLDESFEIGMFEDDDYARRIVKADYKVMCARDSFIHHAGRASFKLLDEDRYVEIFQKNRRIYEQKWGRWKPHMG